MIPLIPVPSEGALAALQLAGDMGQSRPTSEASCDEDNDCEEFDVDGKIIKGVSEYCSVV